MTNTDRLSIMFLLIFSFMSMAAFIHLSGRIRRLERWAITRDYWEAKQNFTGFGDDPSIDYPPFDRIAEYWGIKRDELLKNTR